MESIELQKNVMSNNERSHNAIKMNKKAEDNNNINTSSDDDVAEI